jgi:hypothetical protein
VGSFEESIQNGIERSIIKGTGQVRKGAINDLRTSVQGMTPSQFRNACKAQLTKAQLGGITEPVAPQRNDFSTRDAYKSAYKAYRSARGDYGKLKRSATRHVRTRCAELTKEYKQKYKTKRAFTSPIIDSVSSGINAEIKKAVKGLFD